MDIPQPTTPPIGLVDGSQESSSRRIHVVLEDDALVQLDELLAIPTTLPGGQEVVHFGIVTELFSRLEGADLPSDTARVADRILPAEHVRRAEVTLLRVFPETFVAPNAGSAVHRSDGDLRALALFEDQMDAKLPIGLDMGGRPVHADMRFVDGRAGGHVSISGVSGVATKTSYALFLLYQLLETDAGIDLLGGRTERNRTHVRWCSTPRARTSSTSTGPTAAGTSTRTPRTSGPRSVPTTPPPSSPSACTHLDWSRSPAA